MRITYRHQNNKAYWTKRWEQISADLPMENRNTYPLKYAEMVIQLKEGKILEAGCGAGRILRYYHNRGYSIVGMDFVEKAIAKLKDIDSTLSVDVADITKLPYPDASFRYILAFGLYHNLEHGLDQAMHETFRVLEPGGFVCASFRADNIQTRLTDRLEEYRTKKSQPELTKKEFHKMNLTRLECECLFEKAGFVVKAVCLAENMPILYKFSVFRSQSHKIFDENRARSEGYQLSFIGRSLTKFLMKFFPDQFCNIYVLIAQKPNV